jgi:CBS domain-containing protein
MNAGDIMTRSVVSVAPQTTIAEAAQLMLQHRVSGLPVVDAQGVVIGIVTEGDLLRRAEIGTERRRPRWIELLLGPGRLARDYVDAHARRVSEIMSAEVVSASPPEPVSDVVRAMEKHRIKRLPVVDATGRLVGIISRADLMHALLNALSRPESRAAGSDAEIREQILAEIAKQPWGPRYSVDIVVNNGVVDLHGTITNDQERSALRVVAENTAGVTAVHDHLVWVEPASGFVVSADEPFDGSQTP